MTAPGGMRDEHLLRRHGGDHVGTCRPGAPRARASPRIFARLECSGTVQHDKGRQRLGLADGFISERMQVTCLAGATIGSSPCRATL